ncbi:hypothetical protein D3C72_2230830 [compost metagenome]
MRISSGIWRLEPTRSTMRSWMTRRTLAWASMGMDSISSSSSVPPLANSNLPMRCPAAPVKAPDSWPNNSLSIRSAGMAAQLTATKGPLARGEKS